MTRRPCQYKVLGIVRYMASLALESCPDFSIRRSVVARCKGLHQVDYVTPLTLKSVYIRAEVSITQYFYESIEQVASRLVYVALRLWLPIFAHTGAELLNAVTLRCMDEGHCDHFLIPSSSSIPNRRVSPAISSGMLYKILDYLHF